MKKTALIILPLSIFANALLLGLGAECLLNLLSISVSISFSAVRYPRFIPFCFVLGIIALLGAIAILMLNIKASEKFRFTRSVWIFEYILAFVLSIPMIKLWGILFDFLQKTF